MPSKVISVAIVGLECQPVEVEADISSHLPSFNIVGLPDTAVQESRERVRSAIKNSGAQFPSTRVTVNLAPADIRKEGPAYDLPIALAILCASGQLNFPEQGKIFVGELSLEGKLRHVNGILNISLMAKEKGADALFVPEIDAKEAALISAGGGSAPGGKGPKIIPIKSLAQVTSYLKEEEEVEPYTRRISLKDQEQESKYDMAYVKGQEHVKRALEITAAGAHNLAMTGPPGAGKTLLARTMPSILPKMSISEALEVTRIYSVAGMLPHDMPLIRQRPFRSPHHTASGVALVGGGTWPRPGEISLAHRGVLFLDEFPEFSRQTLENLRQPLEDGIITVARAQSTITFPAKFTLVAAMNPCPCGYLGDLGKECTCSPSQIAKYQKRISGPLLDRIDLHVEVPRLKYEKLADERVAEGSKEVRARVEGARKIQEKRFQNSSCSTNSDMGPEDIKNYCSIDNQTKDLLRGAVNQLYLSARAYHRVLKLARTIADLAGSEKIQMAQVAEALQYRPKQT